MGFGTALALYFHTLRHLKWEQVFFRGYYRLRTAWRRSVGYELPRVRPPVYKAAGEHTPFLRTPVSYKGGYRFSFLNIAHQFPGQVDWNEARHGKLWAYNLNYFEYLAQDGFPGAEGDQLIRDFLARAPLLGNAYEPFPTSLRCLYWIRFLMEQGISGRSDIAEHLYRQLRHLSGYREYHLLGNHLLENGFALFAGGCFFQCPYLLQKGQDILGAQLEEQILENGAHFELSPMYHQLMLYRLLDCINISSAFKAAPSTTGYLRRKAALMLGWLSRATFSNGQIPMVNDSAYGIAPSTASLAAYASQLNIKAAPIGKVRAESGYFLFNHESIEAFFDVAAIGPDYIPGHAHSDTLQILVHIGNAPFLVDPGVSTYEKNSRRQWERSTAAHNTVQLCATEQSEVWGGFRVARRAYPQIVEYLPGHKITGSHDGYKRFGLTHFRSLECLPGCIVITDWIEGKTPSLAHANWHFAPGIDLAIEGKSIITPLGKLHFEGAKDIQITSYEFAQGFNQRSTAQKCTVAFEQRLISTLIPLTPKQIPAQ